jgi:hypothetical protein
MGYNSGMTVAQLIAKLSELPQDFVVVTDVPDWHAFEPMECVKVLDIQASTLNQAETDRTKRAKVVYLGSEERFDDPPYVPRPQVVIPENPAETF